MKMTTRRRLLIVSATEQQSRLPTGFREVEWLQGTGTQYCVTDVYPISDVSNYTCIKGDVTLLNKTDSRFKVSTLWMEGGSVQHYGVESTIDTTINQRIFKFRFGTGNAYNLQLSLNNYVFPLNVHYELNKQDALFNQTTYSKSAPHWTSTKPLIIGGEYSSSSSQNVISRSVQSQFKAFKIYNNDTLLYEFVPCYRTSDNKTGFMKITVADGSTEFFPNLGADEWVIGSVV